MTWGWLMIVLTNSVLLVKIEGPVCYTIYPHRNLVWKEFLQPPLWKSTSQWEFKGHLWFLTTWPHDISPRSPVGCLETLRVAWPAPARQWKTAWWLSLPLLKHDGLRQLVGMMTFPTEWKNIKCSKPPTRNHWWSAELMGRKDPQDPRKGGSQKSLRKGAWFGILVLGSWNPWTNKRYKKVQVIKVEVP